MNHRDFFCFRWIKKESISEVEIAEWLVEDGDYVEKDQAIAEIDSDKATLELPAEKSGKIKIVVAEGETVAVGDVVLVVNVLKYILKSQFMIYLLTLKFLLGI